VFIYAGVSPHQVTRNECTGYATSLLRTPHWIRPSKIPAT